MSGRLLVAATPIGNPGDASERLRQALISTPIIAAEDTRRLERLTAALGIRYTGKTISFFEGNEEQRTEELMELLLTDHDVLLVTDAGMPSVSDPGFRLVRAAIEKEIAIDVLPGPSAVLAALVLSGCAVDRFAFDGFIPRATGARSSFFEQLREERRTVVLFESPHRLAESLEVAATIVGPDRYGAICRELTKTHQEVIRGSLAELVNWAQTHEVLGEICLVINGASEDREVSDDLLVEAVRKHEQAGISRKEAITEVAKTMGVAKRRVFDAMISAKASK